MDHRTPSGSAAAQWLFHGAFKVHRALPDCDIRTVAPDPPTILARKAAISPDKRGLRETDTLGPVKGRGP